jgi:hypothetical protein
MRTTRKTTTRPTTGGMMSLTSLSSSELDKSQLQNAPSTQSTQVARTRRHRLPCKYTLGTGTLGHKGKAKTRKQWLIIVDWENASNLHSMPHLFGLHDLCSFWTVWTLCNWFYGLYGHYRTIVCPWYAVFGLRNVCVVLLYHFITVDVW